NREALMKAAVARKPHNKEHIVMIAIIEGILSLLLPAAVVAGTKHTTGETTTKPSITSRWPSTGKATPITATSPSPRKLTTKVTEKLPAYFARPPGRKRSTPAITPRSSASWEQSPRQR